MDVKNCLKEYKRQHDNVAKKVHWDLFKKNGLEHTEKWYEHTPEGAVENEEVKVLWDISVQCDNMIEARRPDTILIDKKEQKGKRKGESGKVPALKERDWKIVGTKNGRNRACSNQSPWKCSKRV